MKFTHFNVWDNELEAFFTKIKSHDTLRDCFEEIEEWLTADGAYIYNETELKLLEIDAQNSLRAKKRFADMNMAGIIGYSNLALKELTKVFLAYFKPLLTAEEEIYLEREFLVFKDDALGNHQPFYTIRAQITDRITLGDLPNKGSSQEISSLVPKHKSLSPITAYIVNALEIEKQKLAKEAPTDATFNKISEIDQYIMYRKEFEKFAFDATLTPRVTRTPLAGRLSLVRQDYTPAPSPPIATRKPATGAAPPSSPMVTANKSLFNRLKHFSVFDKKSENTSDKIEPEPRVRFSEGSSLRPPK